MKAAILGAVLVRDALRQLDGYEEIVVIDPSANALEQLETDLADPRLDYLLGELPVLPLPDGSVDLVLGEFADDDPEIARVTAR